MPVRDGVSTGSSSDRVSTHATGRDRQDFDPVANSLPVLTSSKVVKRLALTVPSQLPIISNFAPRPVASAKY